MSAGDFLAGMAASSRVRADAARAALPEAELRARIAGLPPAPRLKLSSAGFDLIAEMKLRSPAVGALRSASEEDPAARACLYADAGAAAVSVLTEPSRFDGTLAHLERAAAALSPRGVPAMRKDFLVDPYQVLEARAAGAGGVLLILRMLPRATLERLLDTALEQGLFVLLEAFDDADVEAAVSMLEPRRVADGAAGDPLLLGVNCRDLVSLQVVPGRLEAMADRLPTWIPRVAESGLATPADAARLAACGYDLALVGSALMTGGAPRDLAGAMLAAARDALGHRPRRARASADPGVRPAGRG
jgi:indole-3-glycerol phosphate synthase